MSGSSDDTFGRDREDLRDFTGDAIKNFLRQKAADSACEACGKRDWFLPVEDDDGPTLVKIDILDQEELMHLYITLLCKNCGNTRFFNAGWVLQRMSESDGSTDEQ